MYKNYFYFYFNVRIIQTWFTNESNNTVQFVFHFDYSKKKNKKNRIAKKKWMKKKN